MPKQELTPYEELHAVFKLKLRDGEDYNTFAVRATDKTNNCTDAQWKDMSSELQQWNNDVMTVIDENKVRAKANEDPEEFPPLEGFPAEEEEASGEDAEDENTAEETNEGVDETVQEEQDGEPSSDDEASSETPGAAGSAQKKPTKPDKGTVKPKQEPERRKMRTATAEKEKPAPKSAPAKKKVAAATNGRGRKSKLDPDATIKILAKENPHRAGSARFKRWPKYKDGMTVAAALKAGFNTGDIQHSVDDENIKLV